MVGKLGFSGWDGKFQTSEGRPEAVSGKYLAFPYNKYDPDY